MIRKLILTSILLFTSASAEDRPNVILIMVDDMGYSDLGCYGGEIKTPNIDALAANGVRFSQFTNGARCCPTRASLITGLHPHQTGIGHMTNSPTKQRNPKPESYQGYLNKKCTTVAELLKPAGYSTLMTGKWHLGFHDESRWPRQRGFDRFYGCIPGATRFFHPAHPRGMTLDNKPLENPKSTTDEAFYTTDAFTDYAIKFIDESKADKPFFLYLAYTAPHWPLQAFEDDIARYRNKYKIGWDKLREQRYAKQIELGLIKPGWKLSPRPPKVPAWDSLDEKKRDEMDLKMAVYAAMVDRVDQNIGKLTGFLKNKKLFDNTLILFLSDNGACHEGGIFGRGEFRNIEKRNLQRANSYGEAWANAGSTPFRLYKSNAHQGGTATPFIAHWPKRITPLKQWQTTPAHITDIVPTLLELAGASYPEEELPALEGKSLLPAFQGKPISRDRPLCLEHQGNAFVRDGNWKLVGKGHVKANEANADGWELYDLEKDGTELKDLSSSHPEKRDELIKVWNTWATANGVLPKQTRRK
ncbi:MAG: arylsulfatase [Akkermansiaceae bacterium]